MAASDRRDTHVWRFFRAGGFDQVRIDKGEDIAALGTLDQKLWVALACPTRGLEFDERTLDLIDADHDGRIRAPEILAAVQWATGLLRDPDDLAAARPSLSLAAINDATPEGKAILASARTILAMLGRADADEITLDDTLAIESAVNRTDFNGDGIVPAEAAGDDAEARAAIGEIIQCMGAETDRSSRPGVSQPAADRFFAETADYARWHAEAADPAILPLGAATADAAARVQALRAKLDDYFTRCRLAAFDSRATEALDPPLPAYAALAAQTLEEDEAEIAALPIARIEPDRETLPLESGLNPAWAARVAGFADAVVAPLLGPRTMLAEADWRAIEARFAAYEAWLARKPETAIEPLGPERIAALAASDLAQRIGALIARDKALEPEMTGIAAVEKLVRYHRDLWVLLNNFVSFRDFYTRGCKALFQAGTLYLDGRSCELCVRVGDEAKHAELATLSRIYLAYCRCTRQGQAQPMTIAAGFMAGDSDNLMVGRNGVFYDRKGQDWDATIVKIVEHPISIRQAFWLPYKQAARFMSDQVQKFAAARSRATSDSMAQAVARMQHEPEAQAAQTQAAQAQAQAAQQSQAFDAARFAGVFAAIGLALGAIGTAIASTITGFLQLSWWQMPLALLGIAVIVSGPSVLIAALKLRSRNIGPILDACGWAVNARLRINIPFGTALTAMPQLPEHTERSLSDPYAEKRRPWRLYIAVVAILALAAAAWWSGLAERWLGR